VLTWNAGGCKTKQESCLLCVDRPMKSTITMRTTSIFILRLICALQRILLTGVGSCGYKDDQNHPRATIQEVAARTTVPWFRVSRTRLKSRNESKGQTPARYGRNSDRRAVESIRRKASSESDFFDRFSTADRSPLQSRTRNSNLSALHWCLRQRESA
jgi:hypothetical protein